ncbi:hypothetical protein [Lysobacter sp. CA199]|uniref:hypothetical protein n=1 Tax=Lysobacter sp. CA199 TaxID=3455608 RepID=UPI003F8D4C0F
MCTRNSMSFALVAGALAALLAIAPTAAQRKRAQAQAPSALQDGQHGFDFEFGRWNSHVKRLQRPLSGAGDWVEYRGTTTVSRLHEGRANAAELAVAGPAGRIDGVALRLYDPQSDRWSIHYANLRNGALTAPMVGGFKRGRGEFYGDDMLDGRPIRVRFVIHCPSRDRCLFEQAYSADAGKTWEMNWIGTDTRLPDAAG